jgi:hypothetical protein
MNGIIKENLNICKYKPSIPSKGIHVLVLCPATVTQAAYSSESGMVADTA